MVATVAAQVTAGYTRPVPLMVTESHATYRLGNR
jgi:hypothetical protein